MLLKSVFLATFYLVILREHSEGSVCNYFVCTDSLHPFFTPPFVGGEECSERTLMKKNFQGISKANDKLYDNVIEVSPPPCSTKKRKTTLPMDVINKSDNITKILLHMLLAYMNME